jgi:hypothetical protein
MCRAEKLRASVVGCSFHDLCRARLTCDPVKIRHVVMAREAPRQRREPVRHRAREAHLQGLRIKNHVEIVPPRFGYQLPVSIHILGVDDEAEDAIVARREQFQQRIMVVPTRADIEPYPSRPGRCEGGRGR